MGITRVFIALSIVPHLAFADQLALQCSGSAPNWSLTLDANTAKFDYDGRSSDMTIPQRSIAEGAQWPMAATLIAPRDSAIVLINKRQCGTYDFEMQVLTQRGETPLLLTGCCEEK